MSRKLSILGIVLTAAYAWLLYFIFDGRIVESLTMDPNEIGDLLAGMFGPLAILWLILGFFQQGIELRQNTRALELQAEELKNSVEQQRELANAANVQIKYAKESQKPKFVLQPSSFAGTSMKLQIKNVGAPATNLSIIGSSGFGNISNRQCSLLERNSEFSINIEPVIPPGMNRAMGIEDHYWISLEYEFGNGYSEQTVFDYDDDPGAGIGRFIARKSHA
ncbi:MAG: hypothetical protein HOP03_07110 [Lysobacter sp.]|nr:hypothetical protein [Lysobacter sp.]